MIIETLVVGDLGTNCYVVGERCSGPGLVIDPGGDAERILAVIRKNNLDIQNIVNTHAHFDHILGNRALTELLSQQSNENIEIDVPNSPALVVHSQAVMMLGMRGGADWFGVHCPVSPEPDLLVEDGDTLVIGSLSFQVLHTPGHSAGSICLYNTEQAAVFAGDVLFKRGVGRTDLPGGDWETLMASINNKLFTLPDRVTVYPGHGPTTTIGEEKRGNPFV